MQVKIIELKANVDGAVKNLNKVETEIDQINQGLNETENSFESVNDDAKQLNTTIKKTSNASSVARKGFKAMGLALKAIGIGILIKGLSLVSELFSTNQKVLDTFKTAVNAVTIAFNDFFKFVQSNTETITKLFDKIFNNPLESIKKLGEALKQNIENRIKGIMNILPAYAKIFKQVFELDFEGALKTAADAAGMVILGVDKISEKAADVADTIKNDVIPAVTEYTASTIENASAQTKLANEAQKAEAVNRGLVEQYDLQAETLRQVRDDERKTIQERLKANEDLGEVLDKQEIALKSNAQFALRLANQQLKLDADNVEAQVAKQNALNELAAIEAQVAGFRSEQLTNQAALERELIDLQQTSIEGANQRLVAEAEFNASTKENALLRLEAEAEAIELEKRLGEKRLLDKRNQFAEDTQLFADANQELLTFQQEIGFKQIENEIAIKTEIDRIENEALEKSKAIRQQDLNDFLRINEAKRRSQEQLTQATSGALQSFVQLAGEGTKAGKAAALADVFINTASGISSAIAGATAAAAATGPGAPIMTPLLIAQLVGQVLGGMAAAKNILKKVKGPTASVPSSVSTGGGGGGGSRPPQFNIVGNSGVNQIANAVGSQGPVQAFVVAGAVTTQQQLNNAIVSRATL